MQKYLVLAIAALVVAAVAVDARAQATYDASGTNVNQPSAIEGAKIQDTNDLNTEALLQAQHSLHAAGFDPGPLNGLMGEKTRDALRAFQRARGLQVTGQIDSPTSQALSFISGVTAPSTQ